MPAMKQIDVRKRHKLSRLEFAKRIGVSQAAVWRYEIAGRVPDPGVMRTIIKEFPAIDIASYYVQPEPGRTIHRRRKRKSEQQESSNQEASIEASNVS